MIEAIDDLAEVDIGNLANMPIGDLEDLYSNENGSADDGFFDKNDALTALLGELMLGKEQLEDWNIDIEFDKKDNGRYRMLYVITIKLKGDDKQYIYKIDSRSGDIITENNEEN
jgi:hypothetical protein